MQDYGTAQKLDPKMKTVWRISGVLNTVLNFGGSILILLSISAGFSSSTEQTPAIINILLIVVLLLGAVFLISSLSFIPNLRYKYWSYSITNNFLTLTHGVLWRKRITIPFIRVQDTDTKQGPLLRMQQLWSTTVSTAAGQHEIPGLNFETAELLRNTVAEFSRLAREDV